MKIKKITDENFQKITESLSGEWIVNWSVIYNLKIYFINQFYF